MATWYIFTTEADIPIVTTDEVIGITSNSARVKAIVVHDGGSALISRGIVYSLMEDPTLADYFVENTGGTGNYSALLSDLLPNTTYYVKGYAVNDIGVGYGEEKSFTTDSGVNVFSFSKIHNIIVFPNPADNVINIDSKKRIKAVYLYDVFGKLVYTENERSNSKSFFIKTGFLPSGLYLLKIILEEGAYSEKILIQKNN